VLPALTWLSLYEVKSLTADGLRAVGGVTALTKLNLFNCANVTDAVLRELRDLTALTELYLFNCTDVTNVGLRELRGLPALTTLGLSCCSNVTNTGLQELRNLTAPTWLSLNDCTKVTDAGLQHLSSLTALTTLYLGGTSTTQAAPPSLALPLLRAWMDSKHSRGCTQLPCTSLAALIKATHPSSSHTRKLAFDQASPPGHCLFFHVRVSVARADVSTFNEVRHTRAVHHHVRGASAAATCGSTSPTSACTFSSARASARVSPTVTMASLGAALAKRKAEKTASELPSTSRQSACSANCRVRAARSAGMLAPKNTCMHVVWRECAPSPSEWLSGLGLRLGIAPRTTARV
jgi:hypothetical protein